MSSLQRESRGPKQHSIVFARLPSAAMALFQRAIWRWTRPEHFTVPRALVAENANPILGAAARSINSLRIERIHKKRSFILFVQSKTARTAERHRQDYQSTPSETFSALHFMAAAT